MNNPRLRDVKTGLLIIIRKITLRSKRNSMTENAKQQPVIESPVGPTDLTNWPQGGSTYLNKQSGWGSSEKSSEENGKEELPPDSGGNNK